ncbi:arylsulfatase [Achromobacter arsenitoxydans SY8]|uniref:Arylsulfatase n=2 Tax=Achromobacter TaxID=222 RepID=H0F6Z1_9BURK|nr:arylsulfatase [Achromobacter arsenitoxydans SY8]
MKNIFRLVFSGLAGVLMATTAHAQSSTSTASASASAEKKPNILVIWGDDIGWQNVSAYGMGTMGYTTPNIDSIGQQGIRFTDHYAQPSCTAGRAAFITGQYPIRSGMTTVGQPGDPRGLMAESPSLGEVMKDAGYATGQFGKNHLGDHNSALPTVHGFDEFFGLLYHLNVMEEADQRDYKNFGAKYSGSSEAYEKKFGARNVVHSFASNKDDSTTDPRWGRVGKQVIQDAGKLDAKRMEDFDGGEVAPLAMKFMKQAKDDGKPFFVWLNTSRMHVYTRLNEKWRYAAEQYTSEADLHGSGMMQHDHDVGVILDFLKENGLDENTIVWYSTDNGPEHASWPHGGTTPFRGAKMGTFEGGVRVISMIRWPGVIKPAQTLNGIQTHMDMFTTLAAAAGVANVNERMLKEKSQYIDGINNMEYWLGKSRESARNSLLYYYENKLTAMRMGPWKLHFSEKESYYSNVIPRTMPLLFNLRMDPFESYDNEDSYGHLVQKVSWLMAPMSEIMQQHLKSLADYPPVQGSKTYDMSNVVEEYMNKGRQ